MSTTSSYKLVVGLTGPIACGKGSSVAALVEEFEGQSITFHLLSDQLREIVRGEGKPVTRTTLHEAGNAQREKLGSGALVKRLVSTLVSGNGGVLVVDSIRNPGEIEELRRAFGGACMVIASDADAEDRFRRAFKRCREDDFPSEMRTREEQEAYLREQMEAEVNEQNPETGFDLAACREIADAYVDGNLGKREKMEEIKKEVRRFLEQREFDEREHRREIRKAI